HTEPQARETKEEINQGAACYRQGRTQEQRYDETLAQRAEIHLSAGGYDTCANECTRQSVGSGNWKSQQRCQDHRAALTGRDGQQKLWRCREGVQTQTFAREFLQ